MKDKRKSRKKTILLCIMLCIFFTVTYNFLDKYMINYVPSESMLPTIESSSLLISSKKEYKTTNPQRGDIIVFRYPLNKKTIMVKRIIGMPNEEVCIIDGKIYIDNRECLDEDYLKDEWKIDNDGYRFLIPKNSFLVLGDNRNDSSDARYWKHISMDLGLSKSEIEAENFIYVKQEDIIAKVKYKIFPKIVKF